MNMGCAPSSSDPRAAQTPINVRLVSENNKMNNISNKINNNCDRSSDISPTYIDDLEGIYAPVSNPKSKNNNDSSIDENNNNSTNKDDTKTSISALVSYSSNTNSDSEDINKNKEDQDLHVDHNNNNIKSIDQDGRVVYLRERGILSTIFIATSSFYSLPEAKEFINEVTAGLSAVNKGISCQCTDEDSNKSNEIRTSMAIPNHFNSSTCNTTNDSKDSTLGVCEVDEIESIYGTTMYDKTDESLPENKQRQKYIPLIEQQMKNATQVPVNSLLEQSKITQRKYSKVSEVYGVRLEDRTDLSIPENAEKQKKLYIPEIERKMIEATEMPVNLLLLRNGSCQDSSDLVYG